MKPLILLISIIFLGTVAAHSQTTKDKLEQVKADPKTKERAAKADVYVVKKTPIISDTTAKSNSAAVPSNKKRKQPSN